MEQQKVRGALEIALGKALQSAKGVRIAGMGLVDAYCSPDHGIAFQASSYFQKANLEISSAINMDEDYSQICPKMLRVGFGAIGFYPHSCSVPLLIRAIETDSTSNGLEWLNKILSTDSASGKIFQVIFGVTTQSDISLCDGVSLISIDSLTDSEDNIRLKHRQHGLSTLKNVFNMFYEKSLSIIVDDFVVNPVLVGEDRSIFPTNAVAFEISDICLLLSAVGPRAVMEVMQWFEFDDTDLQLACHFHAVSTGYPEVLPRWGISYPPLDTTAAVGIIYSFRRLDLTTKERLRYVLHRLRQAMLRHSEGDRAVELSIALEAMLTEKTDNSEMTHKISVRAARYLDSSLEKRREIFETIKNIYKVRSRVVHGDDSRSIKNVSEVVNKASVLCASLVRRLITSGAIPNWKDYDLS